MDEEEDRLKKSMGDTSSLQYVILDMTGKSLEHTLPTMVLSNNTVNETLVTGEYIVIEHPNFYI